MSLEVKHLEDSRFGKIRLVYIDGMPWYSLEDICRILELSEMPCLLVLEEGREYNFVEFAGLGDFIVSVSGLYNCIARSDVPYAREFSIWIEKTCCSKEEVSSATSDMCGKCPLSPELFDGQWTLTADKICIRETGDSRVIEIVGVNLYSKKS